MKKIVAGNWKMNMNYKEACILFDDLVAEGPMPEDITVLVAPPALYLSEFMLRADTGSGISIAAQNVHYMPNGAFTGEISANMLASLAIQYCIVGHSERRQLFGESSEIVARKVKALVENGITPLLCVGEMLDERYAGRHFDVVAEQVLTGLSQIEKSQVVKVVIAYEPVWAIGTGQTASSAQAQEVHAFIRNLLNDHFGQTTASAVPILYGGSCNPGNARELFEMPDIDGGLIGGASLKKDDFIRIIQSF